jgi:hypothetical protein
MCPCLSTNHRRAGYHGHRFALLGAVPPSFPWAVATPMQCCPSAPLLPFSGAGLFSSFGLAGALLAGRVPQLTVESLFSGTIQRKVTSQFKT